MSKQAGRDDLSLIMDEDTTLDEKIAKATALLSDTTELYASGIGHAQLGHVMAGVLKTNKSLELLDIGLNGIGEEGTIALMHTLEKNTTLEGLNINGNHIGLRGSIAVARMLKETSSLVVLELSYDSTINAECIYAMAEALSENTSLKTLALAHDPIGPIGLEVLADSLEKNTHIIAVYCESTPAIRSVMSRNRK